MISHALCCIECLQLKLQLLVDAGLLILMHLLLRHFKRYVTSGDSCNNWLEPFQSAGAWFISSVVEFCTV